MKIIINPYYLLWTDAIAGFKKRNFNWKFLSLFLVSFFNSINYLTILVILKLFDVYTEKLEISYYLNNIEGRGRYAIDFIFFMGINYFLIFFNSRYEKLSMKFPNKNGKWFLIYALSSLVIAYMAVMYYGLSR